MSEFRRIRYVERVREATRTLIEDLLEANCRLCLTVSVLGEERSDAAREDLSELDKRSERWRAEHEKKSERRRGARCRGRRGGCPGQRLSHCNL